MAGAPVSRRVCGCVRGFEVEAGTDTLFQQSAGLGHFRGNLPRLNKSRKKSCMSCGHTAGHNRPQCGRFKA